jgi:hypothetical protein
MAVQADAGVDQFLMEDSRVVWGILIDTDLLAAGFSNWGSVTNIQASEIGTHPFGPDLTVIPGSLATADDALWIRGDMARDEVTISGTVVNGTVDLNNLYAGNNEVLLTAGTIVDAIEVFTWGGNDRVLVDASTILVRLYVFLDNGVDTMELRNGSVLPDPLLGFIYMDGGVGADFFGLDPNVVPQFPLTVVNFEEAI